jgi:protein phosphatase 1L
VFDGHAGGRCSKTISTSFPANLASDESFKSKLAVALKRTFATTNDQFLELAQKTRMNDGSTGVCLAIRENKFHVANVGDSRAVLITGGKAIALTKDHKPSSPEEQRRISSFGGVITYNTGIPRVQGVLAVSRAFGNFGIHQYIRADPDLVSREITAEDSFVVLASDGLWDVYRNAEVAEICSAMSNQGCKLQRIVDHLVQNAIMKGSMDNVTCVIVRLNGQSGPPRLAGSPLVAGDAHHHLGQRGLSAEDAEEENEEEEEEVMDVLRSFGDMRRQSRAGAHAGASATGSASSDADEAFRRAMKEMMRDDDMQSSSHASAPFSGNSSANRKLLGRSLSTNRINGRAVSGGDMNNSELSGLFRSSSGDSEVAGIDANATITGGGAMTHGFYASASSSFSSSTKTTLRSSAPIATDTTSRHLGLALDGYDLHASSSYNKHLGTSSRSALSTGRPVTSSVAIDAPLSSSGGGMTSSSGARGGKKLLNVSVTSSRSSATETAALSMNGATSGRPFSSSHASYANTTATLGGSGSGGVKSLSTRLQESSSVEQMKISLPSGPLLKTMAPSPVATMGKGSAIAQRMLSQSGGAVGGGMDTTPPPHSPITTVRKRIVMPGLY